MQKLGDFVIEEKLGRGAFKTVYRARNTAFGRNAYPERVSVRLVRDAIWTVKRQRKSLVFVSPEPALPPELQAEATLLSFPLPDTDALGELATEVQRELAGVARLREQERDERAEPAEAARPAELQHGLAVPAQAAPGHGASGAGVPFGGRGGGRNIRGRAERAVSVSSAHSDADVRFAWEN